MNKQMWASKRTVAKRSSAKPNEEMSDKHKDRGSSGRPG